MTSRASTWFRAVAAFIGFGLVSITPWLIWADAITRAAR